MSGAGRPSRVLVTGASRGIGRAVAEALMARGEAVALSARDGALLEAVRAPAGADAAVVLRADLSNAAEAEALPARAAAALGGLDAVVACAGVVEYREVGAIELSSLRRQLKINFESTFVMLQKAADLIADAGGGSMVVVTSTLVEHPAPMTAAYATSKAALTAMARSFALELAPRGVRVNALAPGVIDTEMVRVVRRRQGEPALSEVEAAGRVQQQLEALRALHPLGRLGTARDVAQSALYLLDADFVTGTVLTVDGGLSLGSGAM
ncbi:MAG: SDR family oxidoreductase [Myxococcales bacterium]|nr:SDR family oxidoreductase [Myxococcales bacterium]